VAIEWICIAFMIFAGINFATHFSPSGRQPRSTARSRGWLVRWRAAVSVLVIAIYIWKEASYVGPRHGPALRRLQCHLGGDHDRLFDHRLRLWPMFAPLWMLFLCSFVTSAGSTGGGIKMMRALLLYKQVYRELVRAMHPNAVYNVRIGGHDGAAVGLFAVLAFGFMYMVSIVSLTLVLSFTGLDIVTAFTAVVASVNNTGPGLGLVGPATTFAVLEDFQTWVCIFAMLLGRLEIFTLLVVLTPAFWRK
jgi:trk system potassium uptake protein